MTSQELCALVAALARDRRRFTLEDAEREGDGAWVAYVYDARPALTYRVADYRAFQAYHAESLPAAWCAPTSRPARNGGRDYSEEEAGITLVELVHILERDAMHDAAGDAGDGTGNQLRALHVRYADDGDDRYRVVARTPEGDDRALTTLAAYLQL